MQKAGLISLYCPVSGLLVPYVLDDLVSLSSDFCLVSHRGFQSSVKLLCFRAATFCLASQPLVLFANFELSQGKIEKAQVLNIGHISVSFLFFQDVGSRDSSLLS